MYISAITRYYIRKLVVQKTERFIQKTLQISVPDNLSQRIEQVLEEFFQILNQSTFLVSELEILVKLHQNLVSQSEPNYGQLTELESKIYTILGLSDDSDSTETSSQKNTGEFLTLTSLTLDLEVEQPQYFDHFDHKNLWDELSEKQLIAASKLTNSVEMDLVSYLSTLNKLSKFAQQYLGSNIIVNYWKITRPSASWLIKFKIADSGKIYVDALHSQSLTTEQQQHLQQWIQAFINQCSFIICNFSYLINKEGLGLPDL